MPAPLPPGSARAHRLHILVVDDNHANQILLRQQQAPGTRRQCAQQWPGGPARPRQPPFDLVITDCQMPVMDGFEPTRNLRARGHDLPVWGFTAHAQPRERELCLPPA
jgi:two-component system sensor histidine kinase EvgS